MMPFLPIKLSTYGENLTSSSSKLQDSFLSNLTNRHLTE